MHCHNLTAVSDDELLHRLVALLKDSRRIEADLIAHIGEVDARKLYAREAAPSMFAYCTEVLHLSEPEAALRIRVARTARKHSEVLTMLRDGRIHLSGVALLAPLLTPRNRDRLLQRATHKSKREIERLVAELAPRPEIPATMRKLAVRQDPELGRNDTGANHLVSGLAIDSRGSGDATFQSSRASLGSTPYGPLQQRPDAVGAVTHCLSAPSRETQRPDVVPAGPPRRAAVEPLSEASYKVTFTASAELHDKLERLQALTRSSVPDGDLGKVIETAVTRELERLEARRFGTTKKPRKTLSDVDIRPKSRHIPAPVRRAVQRRDGGRCTYRDKNGRRCTRRHDLEFHHRDPFGRGGDHTPENLALMCWTHNALMAEQDFGKEVMERFSRSASRVSALPSAPTLTPPETRNKSGLSARARDPAVAP